MNPPTVLIIQNDNETPIHLRDAITARPDYCVRTADGREGLDRALRQKPDIVLLDMMLSGRSGLAVLKRIQREAGAIPVVVFTADSTKATVLEALRLGATHFVEDSGDVDEVLSTIEKAVAEESLKRKKGDLARTSAHVNRQLQEQVHNWTTLNDIAQIISSTLEESEIFRRVMENVTRILKVEACSLLLLDTRYGERP